MPTTVMTERIAVRSPQKSPAVRASFPVKAREQEQVPEPVVEMRAIRKTFLDVVANERVNFSLRPGEICALLGENGAGKTTLMNILFGYYAADEGEILIHGKKVSFASPRDAIACRIGMVHQHFTLVPSQTVLENVVVGSSGGRFFLDMKRAREKLCALQKRFGLAVDPDAPVWTLPIGGQQKVEILKALYRDARILILDEPTAVLAPLETRELFDTLRTLAAEGCSIVFISHKLYEVMEIAHRVVVLAKGVICAERSVSETDERELANLMVGHELAGKTATARKAGAALLSVSRLTVRNDKGLDAVKDLSLDVHSGEVVGLAGVSGNGQMELADALFGLRVPTSGTIVLDGAALPDGNPKSRVDRHMGRIPEDRMTTGLMLDLSVEDNLVMEHHGDFRRSGMLDREAIGDHAEGLMCDFGIKADGRRAPARTLSGGNLQKIILARELSADPKVVVAAQPTRGLDVGAIEYVHGRILEARDRGAATLLISEDLDEIFALSDRIAVLYEGRIMGIADRKYATKEQIGLWMSGIRDVLCA